MFQRREREKTAARRVRGLAAGARSSGHVSPADRTKGRESYVRRRGRAARRVSLGFVVLAALSMAALFSAPSSLASTEGHAYSSPSVHRARAAGSSPSNSARASRSTSRPVTSMSPTRPTTGSRSSPPPAPSWRPGATECSTGPKSARYATRRRPARRGTGGRSGQFINPTGVAVDNSGGPNDGAVYIADTGNGYGPGGLSIILKFSPEGVYLGRINGEDTPGGPFDGLPWNGAIAIDGNGNLFVTTSQRVMKFDAEDNEYVGGSEWLKNGVFSIAVNQGGSKLMVTGYVPSGNEGNYIVNANGTAPGPDFNTCGRLRGEQHLRPGDEPLPHRCRQRGLRGHPDQRTGSSAFRIEQPRLSRGDRGQHDDGRRVRHGLGTVAGQCVRAAGRPGGSDRSGERSERTTATLVGRDARPKRRRRRHRLPLRATSSTPNTRKSSPTPARTTSSKTSAPRCPARNRLHTPGRRPYPGKSPASRLTPHTATGWLRKTRSTPMPAES